MVPGKRWECVGKVTIKTTQNVRDQMSWKYEKENK